MSRVSKELLRVCGSRLRLGEQILDVNGEPRGVRSTGPHQVKFLSDRLVMGRDDRGNPCEYVHYVFNEGGQTKFYPTKKLNNSGELSYLVCDFAKIEEGSELVLEMKKRGSRNYIDVRVVSTPIK